MPDLFKGWDGGLLEDGGSGGVTDHGALTGLEDNDHPQYRLVTEDITDHGNLSGLTDDDHSQYLNNTRHDTTARHTLGSVVPQDSSKADDDAVVHDTGDETVAGVKTFSSFPVTPSSAPTSDYQVANKKYVDDNGGGGSGGGGGGNDGWPAVPLLCAGASDIEYPATSDHIPREACGNAATLSHLCTRIPSMPTSISEEGYFLPAVHLKPNP